MKSLKVFRVLYVAQSFLAIGVIITCTVCMIVSPEFIKWELGVFFVACADFMLNAIEYADVNNKINENKE